MRNDDSEYVRHIEQALKAAEFEIKVLEEEIRMLNAALTDVLEKNAPFRMGEFRP